MKTVLLLLVALSVNVLLLFAQNNSYAVKPSEDANTTIPDSIRFYHPQFTQGNVFFRDGSVSGASLNYNLLSGEMQFIAPKGDTLAVTNEATIKYVALGSDTFFYDKAFLQLIAGNATAKLAKKEALAIGDIKKSGGYDQLSSASAITTVSSINAYGRSTNLTEQKEILLSKVSSYYIGDVYNHFLPVTKKNIIRLFGQKQTAIEQYLKDNKVTFNKEQDLKALIDFLER